MEKIPLSRSAETIEYSLVRRILHKLDYGATRSGDHLIVYEKRSGYNLYVKEGDQKEVTALYIDEGIYSDTLHADGHVGLNRGWIELCNINSVLRLILRKIAPDLKYKSSPYRGSGSTARFYNEQYVKNLKELLPKSDLADEFKWIEIEDQKVGA